MVTTITFFLYFLLLINAKIQYCKMYPGDGVLLNTSKIRNNDKSSILRYECDFGYKMIYSGPVRCKNRSFYVIDNNGKEKSNIIQLCVETDNFCAPIDHSRINKAMSINSKTYFKCLEGYEHEHENDIIQCVYSPGDKSKGIWKVMTTNKIVTSSSCICLYMSDNLYSLLYSN